MEDMVVGKLYKNNPRFYQKLFLKSIKTGFIIFQIVIYVVSTSRHVK